MAKARLGKVTSNGRTVGALKLQGSYMGRLFHATKKNQATARRIHREKGVAQAISFLKKERAKRLAR